MGKQCLLPVLALLLLSSCSSMSKKECLSADWLQRGVQDGSRGLPDTTLAKHDKACARISVVPNRDLYFQGHEQGLLSYCTADKGLSEGKRNNDYQGVCPADLETDFLVSYIDGLEWKLIDLESDGLMYRLRLSNLYLEHAVRGRRPGRNGKKLVGRISSQENLLRHNISQRRFIRNRIAKYRLLLK